MSAGHATATKRDCPRDPHLALQPVKGERQEDGKYHSLVEAEPQGGAAGPQQLVGVRVGHAGRAAAVDGTDHVALAHPLRGRAATWIHLQHVTLFSLLFFSKWHCDTQRSRNSPHPVRPEPPELEHLFRKAGAHQQAGDPSVTVRHATRAPVAVSAFPAAALPQAATRPPTRHAHATAFSDGPSDRPGASRFFFSATSVP